MADKTQNSSSSSSTSPPNPTEDPSCTGQFPQKAGLLSFHTAEERFGVQFPSDAFGLLEQESDDLVSIACSMFFFERGIGQSI